MKARPTFKKSLIISMALFAWLPLRGETVTLVATVTQEGVTAYSAPVTLAAGDTAQILYSFPLGQDVAQVIIGASTFNLIAVHAGFGVAPVLIAPSVAGPATIRAQVNGNTGIGNTTFITVAVTRANAVSSVTPQSAVVIPEDASGPVQIVLESSTDLVTWTAANPGSYASSTQRRFFRVRAVQQ